MKNTSKLILGTLIVAIVFTLLSVSLAASSGDYKYDVKPDGTVILTKYTGNSADVTIPDTIDGKTVSAIGERAFRYASITSVTIPGCVNSIGLKAFLSCENLKTVVFQPSDDPLEIGDYAFDGDTSLVNVDIGAKQINLHERAFRYCSALQTISFSNDPTELSIGEKGFLNCTGLLSLDVPDSVQSLSIGAYAFDGDTALQDIQLSGETIKLNERAFRYCSAIHKVTFADNTTALEVGEKAFLGCSEMVFFDVPSQVTEFSAGGYAFDGAPKLAVVGLGGGNAKLGERCFRYCESLTKLLIPNGNVTIGDKAFLGCNDLTLYVAPGSAAEQYAINNRLSFSDASQYEPVVVDDSNYVAPTADEAPAATEQSSEPASQDWTCPNCGNEASGNFCNNCGTARPAENEPASTLAPTAQPKAAPVDSSDARHLQYIRNYVGLNALSIGYTSSKSGGHTGQPRRLEQYDRPGQTPAARGWSGPASGPPQRPRGGGGRGRYRPTFPPGPCRPSSGGAFPASRELPQAGPHRVPRPSRPPKPSPARGGSSHGAGPAPKPPYPSAGVSPMPKHPLRPRRPGRPSRRRPGPSGPLDRPPSGV